MWKLFENRYPGREVVEGCVYCVPSARSVDVEHCLGCPRLLGVWKASDTMLVRCRVRVAPGITQLSAMTV